MTETPTHAKGASHEIKLKAEVEQVNFHSEDSGWSALKVRDVQGGMSLTAVGHLPEAVQNGQYFMLFGRWSFHKTFGQQFHFTRAVSARPHSRDGIARYLASGLFKGVGKATAKKIVDHFGLSTFDLLDSRPEQIRQVPGLGKKLAGKIIKGWLEHKRSHEAQMFLLEHGIIGATAKKLINKYGASLIERLSNNPYFLIPEVRGIGFQKADQIGLSVGMSLRHPERIRAGILFLLGQGEDQGHCYLSGAQLLSRLQSQLRLPDFSKGQLAGQLQSLFDALTIISVRHPEGAEGSETGEMWHFRRSVYEDESGIAHKIFHLINSPGGAGEDPSAAFQERVSRWTRLFCEKTGHALTDQQKKAVLLAASSKVFILTGGPGVGKTTTANTIITLFRAMGKSIALAAPTGRAAQRLSEVSGQEARTIHRLLEWSAQDACFKRHKGNPLAAQAVMIDEASMLDSRLAHQLIAAIPASAQLILMGDADQLPSVGPGNVLRDLIRSKKVCCLKLDRVFRQASDSRIIAAAHSINRGENPEFNSEPESDCRFICIHEPERVLTMIRELLTIHLPQAGYDPLRDVQILTPMNKGELGSLNLNQKIQSWINPGHQPGTASGGALTSRHRFLKEDKVIQNVNNYDLGVFNGDIGLVTATQVEGAALRVHLAGKDLNYSQEQSRELNLAYAITIHKAQGSEFPVVIIPMSMSHYVMLRRNLIYTALTRAKKLAIFVGEPKALAIGVQNADSHARQTWLVHELERVAQKKIPCP